MLYSFAVKDMGNETGLAQVTPYKLMDALKDSIVKRGTSFRSKLT